MGGIQVWFFLHPSPTSGTYYFSLNSKSCIAKWRALRPGDGLITRRNLYHPLHYLFKWGKYRRQVLFDAGGRDCFAAWIKDRQFVEGYPWAGTLGKMWAIPKPRVPARTNASTRPGDLV